MKHHRFEIFFAGVLMALTLPAEAHPGHAPVYDTGAGLLHPLLGPDHLLAMLGVGLWAGFSEGLLRVTLPAAFWASMAAGAAAQFAGMPLPGAEDAVAASVAAIGLILASGRHFRAGMAVLLSALFAFSHGYVHAAEAVQSRDGLYYAAGFLASTALLLGCGLWLAGTTLGYRGRFRTAFGMICAGAGLGLLLGA